MAGGSGDWVTPAAAVSTGLGGSVIVEVDKFLGRVLSGAGLAVDIGAVAACESRGVVEYTLSEAQVAQPQRRICCSARMGLIFTDKTALCMVDGDIGVFASDAAHGAIECVADGITFAVSPALVVNVAESDETCVSVEPTDESLVAVC